MAIAHALTDTAGDIASTIASQSATLPTGVGSTHRLILIIVNEWGNPNAAQASSLSAGWTQVGSTVSGAGSGGSNVQLSCWQAAGTVGATTITNTKTGASYQQGYLIAAFTGVDTTTPIDVAGTGNNSTGAATLTTNAITIATDQSWHLIGGGDWLGTTNASAPSFTASENGHSQAATWLLYNTTPKSTGSTGTVVVTGNSGSTQIICGQPFALRPAAAAGGGGPFPWFLDQAHSGGLQSGGM